MNKHYCTRKPIKCPKCGERPVANILYGLAVMSDELQNDIDLGKTVIGGCVIWEDSPKWHCVNCNTDFYKKKPRDHKY